MNLGIYWLSERWDFHETLCLGERGWDRQEAHLDGETPWLVRLGLWKTITQRVNKTSSHLVESPIRVFRDFSARVVSTARATGLILITEWMWMESQMYLGWLCAVLCAVWSMSSRENSILRYVKLWSVQHSQVQRMITDSTLKNQSMGSEIPKNWTCIPCGELYCEM